MGGVMRRILPAAGILAGTAIVGGAMTYGSIRAAGDVDGKVSGTRRALGEFGGIPLAPAAVAAMGVWLATGKLRGTLLRPTPYNLLLFPAAITGAWLGASMARNHLRAGHEGEYRKMDRLIDRSIEDTRDALRAAGSDEAMLEPIPASYDRSYLRASYNPPIGPLGNDIRIGRVGGTGTPYAANDVIAHEFAHKVVDRYAGWLNTPIAGDEAHAIVESLADTIAMAVDRDDWTIGEDAVPGGIRSISNPELRGATRDGELLRAPITKQELVNTSEPHLGAGVGNKAAWRIGDQLGRDVMLKIYVAALKRDEFGVRSTYDDLARTLRAAADDLYGAGSREATVVDQAWKTAGY